MLKGFAGRETGRLWKGRRSKAVPPHLREKAVAKLLSIDIAADVRELEVPPGNRLHRLGGDREGQWSIRINRQYRICFRFEGGDAYEVEITDYH